MADVQPSTYQEAARAWVQRGTGNAVLNAVAGSGKTWTLVWLAQEIGADALFVAFNRHIAGELGEKLAPYGMAARTIHSIGYRAVAAHLGVKLKVKGDKYRNPVRRAIAAMTALDKEERDELEETLRRLVDLVRLTLTNYRDREALQRMCRHYGLIWDDRLAFELVSLLQWGEAAARATGEIDFTDMVYLPVVWDLKPPQVKWLLIDELQDLNAAQRELVLKCVRPDGRILGVGDPRQAIYGFAGADADAFARFIAATRATVLPLSVCYRCPRDVIALAQEIVPQIESAPGAARGDVLHMSEEEAERAFREEDLILCRTNAPLVSMTIRLISQRRPAKMRGRDIGQGLCNLLDKISQRPGFTYDKIIGALEVYRAEKEAWLVQKDASEARFQALQDQVECLTICIEDFGAHSVEALKAEITAMFSDDRAAIYLSSVHRAKGLEADRVFILQPDKLPLTWANQMGWESEQEMNLRYVALTRAKQTLTFINPA